jgi:hypothetical protein
MDSKHISSFIARDQTGMVTHIRWIFVLPAIALVLLLISCAGTPPKEAVSQAELAVNKVGGTNATQIAPLDLRKAQDHLEQAKQAMQKKDYTQARRLAENALVEAELAATKTQAQETQARAAELQQNIKDLREEATPQ